MSQSPIESQPADAPGTEAATVGERDFPCVRCGAQLTFHPGTDTLTCAHCGTANAIPDRGGRVEELDYAEALRTLDQAADHADAIVVKCDACGAETSLGANVTSASCAFCGTAIVAQARSRRLIRPRSLLPFAIDRARAREMFDAWIRRLWFAPSDLKKIAEIDSALVGCYVPFWTYDARATTAYTGKRGDDYWETAWVTVVVNGKSQRRPRQVRKTRWRFVSGVVSNRFDDVLVPASTTLPAAHLDRLGAWDLAKLTPYADEYLSGFQAESYTVDLPRGFERAREIMAEVIRATIRRDIGGDHQVILSMRPEYSGISFKHILLPVWVSAYRYGHKVYRFLVNARTGVTAGDRPYSALKIALAILLVLAVLGIAAAIALSMRQG